MKFHKMLVEHDPGNGMYGDCFRACIASLLDYDDPENVPHVFKDYRSGDGERLLDQMRAWLKENHGLDHISFPFQSQSLDDMLQWMKEMIGDTPCILLGRSKRSNHCVLVCDGVIVHDPNPEIPAGQHSIIGPADDGFWWVEVLVHCSAAQEHDKEN